MKVTLLSVPASFLWAFGESVALHAPICTFQGQGWNRPLVLSARIVAAARQLLTSLSLLEVPAGIRPVCSEEKSNFLYFVLSQTVTIY